MAICADLISAIGSTPLIHLKHASDLTGSTILGKAEFMNPGGSVKDQDSIDCCDKHGLAMVFSGKRHFKH